MTDRPRVGQIPFLNCHPLHFGLLQTGAIDEFDVVSGTPAELARLMLAGELDFAPLSSIEYLRHADQFLLLPNLAIGSTGAVRSVQLVGKVAPESLRGPVAMSDASVTSHVLTALLLRELWSVDVECFSCKVQMPQVFERAEAALLIGDDALRAAASHPAGLYFADLGKAWADLTGLPMTYAVWAVRREYAGAHPAQPAAVAGALSASLAWSLAHMTEVIADASARVSMSEPDLGAYFAGLDYDFGEQAQRGLMAFAERAREQGFLTSVPELEFVEAAR